MADILPALLDSFKIRRIVLITGTLKVQPDNLLSGIGQLDAPP
jgi:hypothetical protein